MPLAADPEQTIDEDDLIFVRFAMFDGETAVLCRVATDVLNRLAEREGLSEPYVETFRRLRPEIEAAASRKYDLEHLEGGALQVYTSDIGR